MTPAASTDLPARLADGSLTATELVAAARRPDGLGATERLLDNAPDEAVRSDGRRRDGAPRGPLDGVPFAVKANIDVAGVPTTSGTALTPAPADSDAAAVAAWRAAGLIPVRTATLAELAVGSVTDNPHTGSCRNPHDPRLAAGGSSGGSGALVGAGVVPLALGSDTMGSVRIPAAYCGVVGYKPSRGAVDPAGLTPLHPLLDTVGVIADSVRGLRAAADPLLGTAHAVDARGVRVAAVEDLVGLADDAGRAATETVLARLRELGGTAGTVRLGVDLGLVRRRGLLLCEADTYRRFAAQVDADDPGLSERVRGMLRYGHDAGEERVNAALATLRGIETTTLRMFDAADVLVSPTTLTGPPEVGVEPAHAADLAAWVNVAGLCAITVPAGGPAPDGIRRGVQLIGRPGADARLLACAEAVERAGLR